MFGTLLIFIQVPGSRFLLYVEIFTHKILVFEMFSVVWICVHSMKKRSIALCNIRCA